MLSLIRTALIGASLLFVAQVESADYQEIYQNRRGSCTFDFDNPNGYFAYNGIANDDNTGGDGVGSGYDLHDFQIVCRFQFIGRDQQVEQTATYQNPTLVQTVVVPFTDAPVTSIVPGSNVECTAFPGTTQIFSIRETFALISTAPIPPVTATTTVVIMTSAVTTATTTTIVTQPTETTITPNTVTSTVATGTKTVVGKPALTTKTITITPWARTVKNVAVTYTTTTLSCVPPKAGGSRNSRQERALAIAHEVFARQANTNIETASCFGEQPVTPTITNTQLTTSTSTETVVEQSLTTTTIVDTVFAPAPTTVLNVQATTTYTPTFTRYRWTVLPRATVTKTIAITNTVTKLPKTRLTPCVKPTAMPQPVSGPLRCKNPTTSIENNCQKVQCN